MRRARYDGLIIMTSHLGPRRRPRIPSSTSPCQTTAPHTQGAAGMRLIRGTPGPVKRFSGVCRMRGCPGCGSHADPLRIRAERQVEPGSNPLDPAAVEATRSTRQPATGPGCRPVAGSDRVTRRNHRAGAKRAPGRACPVTGAWNSGRRQAPRTRSAGSAGCCVRQSSRL